MAENNQKKESSALSQAASAAGAARSAVKTGKALAGAAKGAAAGPYGMLAAGLWENRKLIRYFEHPVSMDICEAFVKLQSGRIYEDYKLNHHHLLFMDKTFEAEILNVRAESKPSRDLIQDLQDIQNGIEICYDADLRKANKEQKSKQRAEAKAKKIQAFERKLLEIGYENLESYSLDKVHADKWLEPERIQELTELREKRIEEEKTSRYS